MCVNCSDIDRFVDYEETLYRDSVYDYKSQCKYAVPITNDDCFKCRKDWTDCNMQCKD